MGFKGDIGTIPAATVIQLLGDERKTGVLLLKSGKNKVKFFMKDGAILCVMGSMEETRLGKILVQKKLITEQQLSECIAYAKRNKMALGKLLVVNCYITWEQLNDAIQTQAREIMLGMMTWQDGMFEYRDGRINMKKLVIADINYMQILLEALQKQDEDPARKKRRANHKLPVIRSFERLEANDKPALELAAMADAESPNGEIDLEDHEWRNFWRN